MKKHVESALQGCPCFNLGAAYRRVLSLYAAALTPLRLNVPQSNVLIWLLEHDGENLKTIAQAVALDSSTVTYLLDKLEKKKLVERREDPTDRRGTKVFLTQQGRALQSQIERITGEFRRKIDTLVSAEEYNTFLQVTQKFQQM